MKRASHTPELLDGPLDPSTLSGNLVDLARVNRWLGGSRLSLKAIAPLAAASSSVNVLDVGTGAADIPRYVVRHARAEFTAVDIRPEIVAAAAANGMRGVTVRLGRLEDEPDASFDVVHASLVLHHLDEDDARSFLAAARRVARQAVVINDLERGWRWFTAAWLLTRVATRNAYTRHDGPLSVRRAYSADEVAAMARGAGLRPVAHYRAIAGYRYAQVFVRA